MHTSPTPEIDLTLKRNCSMSPQALLRVLTALAVVALGIAAAFAATGAWPVLPFAGIEVAALAAAFYFHARHACDYERIRLDAGSLVVEVRNGQDTHRCEFERGSVRLEEVVAAGDYRLALTARGAGTPIEIGRHMDQARRRELAATLRRALFARC